MRLSVCVCDLNRVSAANARFLSAFLMIFNQLSVGQTDNVLTADAELCVYVHHRMCDVADMTASLSHSASSSNERTIFIYLFY